MKTACRLMLLAVLAAGPGCWTLPSLQPAAPAPAAAPEPLRPRDPVLPERVNSDNAHQAAAALSEELDQAERDLHTY
jgi:hypothetical protein